MCKVRLEAFVDPRLNVFKVENLLLGAKVHTTRLASNFEVMTATSRRDSRSNTRLLLKTEVSSSAICSMQLRSSHLT